MDVCRHVVCGVCRSRALYAVRWIPYLSWVGVVLLSVDVGEAILMFLHRGNFSISPRLPPRTRTFDRPAAPWHPPSPQLRSVLAIGSHRSSSTRLESQRSCPFTFPSLGIILDFLRYDRAKIKPRGYFKGAATPADATRRLVPVAIRFANETAACRNLISPRGAKEFSGDA